MLGGGARRRGHGGISVFVELNGAVEFVGRDGINERGIVVKCVDGHLVAHLGHVVEGGVDWEARVQIGEVGDGRGHGPGRADACGIPGHPARQRRGGD